MELVDIKMLRTFLKNNIVTDLNAVRDKKTGGWKLEFKLDNGKKFGLMTAIKNEKIYAKLDTAIFQIEAMIGRPLNTTKLL